MDEAPKELQTINGKLIWGDGCGGSGIIPFDFNGSRKRIKQKYLYGCDFFYSFDETLIKSGNLLLILSDFIFWIYILLWKSNQQAENQNPYKNCHVSIMNFNSEHMFTVM